MLKLTILALAAGLTFGTNNIIVAAPAPMMHQSEKASTLKTYKAHFSVNNHMESDTCQAANSGEAEQIFKARHPDAKDLTVTEIN